MRLSEIEAEDLSLYICMFRLDLKCAFFRASETGVCGYLKLKPKRKDLNFPRAPGAATLSRGRERRWQNYNKISIEPRPN